MKTLLVASIAVLALAGCATLQGATPAQDAAPAQADVPAKAPAADSPAASLASITNADLEAAAKQADADGDAVAAACWRAMEQWLGNRPAAPAVVGAFSAIQAARSATRRISAGVPDAVHVACAPVVLDAQGVAIRLGLIAAGMK